MKRKVCVVTGSRADYGLLYWVMKEIEQAPEFELLLIATGMHLSPEFGLTYKVIEKDGFKIDEKIEMLLSSDTPVGISKSVGLATIGFAEAYHRLKPDLIIVLGDRYEILAAAQAALIAKIPLAHIAGGDLTVAAFDEAIRHSITKMAHLHFVTNRDSYRIVRQLGENPEHIYIVGSPGLDYIKRAQLLNIQELEHSLEFKFKKKNVLVTFHPVTLEEQSAAEQFRELLMALEELGTEVGILFTKPNSDTEGRELIRMVDEFVSSHPNSRAYQSLGQQRYLSTIALVDAVIGNSSSGLYEVPSFKKPTVNIGDRQKGRLQASSVISCLAKAADISAAIDSALEKDCSDAINPYGDGDSAARMVAILKEISDYQALIKKEFYKVDANDAQDR